MPVHWFRVGYMANALARCAAGISLDGLSVRALTALMERFTREYRAQHVESADDVLTIAWTPDAGGFRVSATRTVTRHDDGRADEVVLSVLVRATPARIALGAGAVHTVAELRAGDAYRLTADARPTT